MGSLIWSDIHFDEEVPYFRLKGCSAKNRKTANIVIHPDLFLALSEEWKKGHKKTDPVFRSIPRVEIIRKDLEKAGIDFRDEEGRVIDLHAFRKTFGTCLAKTNISEREQMEALRLKDRGLMNFVYTDSKKLGTNNAILGLDSFSKKPVSQIVTQKPVSSSLQTSQPDTNTFQMSVSQSAENEQVLHGLTGIGTSWHKEENGARCRVRTCDNCRVKAVLYR